MSKLFIDQFICSLGIIKRLAGDCLVPLDPVTYRHTYAFYREIHNRCTDNELNDSFGTKQHRFFTKKIVHKKMQGNMNFHQNVDASAVIKSFPLHKNCATSVTTPRSFRCLVIL